MRMRMAGMSSSPSVAAMKRFASSRAGERKSIASAAGMRSRPWRALSSSTRLWNWGSSCIPRPKSRMSATASL